MVQSGAERAPGPASKLRVHPHPSPLPHAPAARGRRLTSLKRGRGTWTGEDRTGWTGQLSLHEKTTPEKRAGNPSLLLWGTDQNR